MYWNPSRNIVIWLRRLAISIIRNVQSTSYYMRKVAKRQKLFSRKKLFTSIEFGCMCYKSLSTQKSSQLVIGKLHRRSVKIQSSAFTRVFRNVGFTPCNMMNHSIMMDTNAFYIASRLQQLMNGHEHRLNFLSQGQWKFYLAYKFTARMCCLIK